MTTAPKTPLLIAFALLIAACSDKPVARNAKAAAPEIGRRTVHFIAFGDAGKGNANQRAVAAAMVTLCKLKPCDFGLEFGDNIYPQGVMSSDDPQWQDKFELPYKDLDIPIYPALGNHDNWSRASGSSQETKGETQVAYTTAAENISRKWRLPARYHNFAYPKALAAGESPVVEFFCLDSNPLAASVPDSTNSQYNYLTYGSTQLQWLQSELAASKARWTVAYAHHPYVSNGLHGDAGLFDGKSADLPGTANGKPWLDFLNASICNTGYRGGVDFFMFGHDHELEWLKPVKSCNAKTEFIMNGAASDPRPVADANRHPVFYQKDDALGFAWHEVGDTSFRTEIYVLDASGKLKLDDGGNPPPDFTRTVTKPSGVRQ